MTPPSPAAAARRAGVTAVWAGNCSGTVDLARLAGPRSARIGAGDGIAARLPGRPPWQLAEPRVRVAVYRYCLTAGSPFEIYRWVNLTDLAAVWASLALPRGLAREWRGALEAAGLVTAA